MSREIIKIVDKALQFCEFHGDKKVKEHVDNLIVREKYKKIQRLFSNKIKFKHRRINGRDTFGYCHVNRVTMNIVGTSIGTLLYRYRPEIYEVHTKHFKSTDIYPYLDYIYIGYDTRANSLDYIPVLAGALNLLGYIVNVSPVPVLEPFVSFMSENARFRAGIYITGHRRNKNYCGLSLFLEDGCRITGRYAKKLNEIIESREYRPPRPKYVYEDYDHEEAEADFIKFFNKGCKRDLFYFFENAQTRKVQKIVIDLMYSPALTAIKNFIEHYKLIGIFEFYDKRCRIDPELGNLKNTFPSRKNLDDDLRKFANDCEASYIFMTDSIGTKFRLAAKRGNEWCLYSTDEIAMALLGYLKDVFHFSDLLVITSYDVSNAGIVAAMGLYLRFCRANYFRRKIDHLICDYRKREKGVYLIFCYNKHFEFIIHMGKIPSALHMIIILGCFTQYYTIEVSLQSIQFQFGRFSVHKQKIKDMSFEKVNELVIKYCESRKIVYRKERRCIEFRYNSNHYIIFSYSSQWTTVRVFIDRQHDEQTKKNCKNMIANVIDNR